MFDYWLMYLKKNGKAYLLKGRKKTKEQIDHEINKLFAKRYKPMQGAAKCLHWGHWVSGERVLAGDTIEFDFRRDVKER